MEDAENKKFKGTTTVGLVCSDGMVFAADKRATMGYFIANREMKKIFDIDGQIGMTVAGSVGDAQMLIRMMKAEAQLYKLENNGRQMPVEGAAIMLSNLLNQYKMLPFLVQLLVGGIDEQPKLFNLDLAGGVTEEKFVSTGSGSLTAYGVLENDYVEARPVKENMKIAVKAISTALKRDCGSGDGVDLVTITKDGFKRYSEDEVKKILEAK